MSRWVLVLVTLLVCGIGLSWGARLNNSRLLFPDYPPSSRLDDEAEEDSGELKTFQEVENKIRGLIDDVIKKLLPYVIRSSADIRLSGRCMASIFKLVIGMQKLQEWAIKMVDATGKPPSGVFKGTTMSLGDFDECLDIKVGKKTSNPLTEEDEFFHGKYCTVECKLPKGILDALDEYQRMPEYNKSSTPLAQSKTILNLVLRYGNYMKMAAFRFGVCIPSTCDVDDLGSIVNTVTKQLGFPLKVLHCQEPQKLEFKIEHIILICILSSIILTVLGCTAADIFFAKYPNIKASSKMKTYMVKISESLSMIRNTQKLFDVEEDNHPMPILRGLLVLTVVASILGHTYLMYNHLFFFKYSSLVNYLDYMQQFMFAFIANGSNGVENFFYICGFLTCYIRWRKPLSKPKVDISQLILKPFVRMSFLQLLAISLFLLLPLIGYGPFWGDFVGPYLQSCRTRWWLNLFYIQNYWSAEDTCLYHTWVLAAVMQLYLISIVVLWFLIRKPNVGIALNITLIMFGMAAVGATIFVKQLPGALSLYLLDGETGPKWWNSIYIQTFDHVGAYCIGMLTGYAVAKHQQKIRLKSVTVIVFWCISVACVLAVICGLYEYRYGNIKMSTSLSILYAMVNRNIYTLFLTWFTVACITDNAGFLPRLLSWKAFIPIFRMSPLAYLLHLIVIYYHVGILRERVYLSHEENVINYFGYLVTTYIFAYLCYILFQVPYMNLEKLIINTLCRHYKIEDLGSVKYKVNKAAQANAIDSKPKEKSEIPTNRIHSILEGFHFEQAK